MRDVEKLAALLDELIQREETVIKIAKSVKDSLSSGAKESSKVDVKPVVEVPAPKTEETPAKEEKTYSKEEVRALLSQKAKADSAKYKVEVKALVAKYSSDGTLTNVPVESYADLMAELEVVGNG